MSDEVKKRLSGYWKLEAVNILLIPAALVLLSSAQLGWLSLLAFLPMMLLLAIGAYYWRAKLHQITRAGSGFDLAIRRIGQLQWPSLGLMLTTCLIVIYAWTEPGWFRGSWDKGAATFASVLSVLEYVNYYHRQLQHFDNWPDFKRLLRGKGLRRSQMARDLKAYRNK
ncbi:MAG: hypothetical protein AAGB16_00790 [Pseudomonadota bacterium]